MSQHRISIIVAIDEKRGIGKGNDLLFRIPEDGKRVRTLTTNHPLIMGRKTFASLGRKLPNRSHIVVTHNPDSLTTLDYQPDAVVSSIEEGIEQAKEMPGNDEIFIFGGGQIYRQSIEQKLVDRLYLTIVKGDYHADTFFPDYSSFKTILSQSEHTADGYTYTFLDLER